VYLFAKSAFVIGQFPPAFVILFLKTCHLQNLQNFKIYIVHKPLKEFCVLVC